MHCGCIFQFLDKVPDKDSNTVCICYFRLGENDIPETFKWNAELFFIEKPSSKTKDK